MTSEQWAVFTAMARNPRLPATPAFIDWLWRVDAPGGPALERELTAVAYIPAYHIYGREERTAEESWELVGRAVGMMRSANLQAVVARLTQQMAQDLVAEVEQTGTPVERLPEPEEIFFDMGREALLLELERLCDHIRRPELT